MYKLTLTHSERMAFDWVGDRYSTGDEVGDILRSCLTDEQKDNDAWDSDSEIVFEVPEGKAWLISDLATQEDNLWPCFSRELKEKMQIFCYSIV